MNPFKFLGLLISPVTEIVKGWQDRRKVKLEGEQRIEKAKVEATIKNIETNDSYDARLEELSLQNRGWKDEYLLLITTSPVVLVFFPSMVPVLEAGFKVLSGLPDWYLWLVLLIYIDTFGFRRVARAWMSRKVGS